MFGPLDGLAKRPVNPSKPVEDLWKREAALGLENAARLQKLSNALMTFREDHAPVRRRVTSGTGVLSWPVSPQREKRPGPETLIRIVRQARILGLHFNVG